VFNANAHQPGAQRLLGRTYEDDGLAQGEAALPDIARHPSPRNSSRPNSQRHFVADDPRRPWWRRLQDVVPQDDGDLKALAMALVDSDDACMRR